MSRHAPSASRAPSGYRKGGETHARILDAALIEFGLHGYAAATTRQIADRAAVNLPALTYYFGGKEGLYLACAQRIVAGYRDGVGTVAQHVADALAKPLAPGEAAALLQRLMAALARFLLSTGEVAHRTLFVQREIASPGPAFEILYAELWRPGIELAAELIAHARGGMIGEGEARLRAVMMISSLTGLVEGRDIVARAISVGDQADAVIAILEEQIEGIVRPG
ncbi:CerR family C-terminal domain-containing protein [Sphingopyxis sp. PET50]|uniref:CerR family C-terminal domain-containing protein n=1 Tax=Sphingopyxis sp. PET50 TaxID=2976533 RepID=UPI0021AF547A|nr:CerR family C-terminal domain-containing protein [Sphingopyxis sp. PET50]